MLRNTMLFVGLSASLAIAAAAGCGGDTSSSSGTSNATSGGNGGEAPTGAQPPGPPSNGMKPDGAGHTVFAITKLYLGDTDRSGNVSSTAWQTYGYDIDNVDSECTGNACATSIPPQCKPFPNSAADALEDGPKGVDNGFGHSISPTLAGFMAGDAANGAIASGSFTVMIDLEQLGSGANYTGMLAKLYGGSNLNATPKFDGTDMWPVIPELLGGTETDITNSKVQFPTSYVTNNTWVSGSANTVTLQLAIKGYMLNLNIAHAVISMQMDSNHKTASNGVISGVLNTAQFVMEVQQIIPAAAMSMSFCQGSALDAILNTLRGASDIMSDGTAGTPSVQCDGISIAIGFDAAIVQLGGIGPKSTPAPPYCP